MSIGGARSLTQTRGSEGRLVRSDAIAGGRALFANVAVVRGKRREPGQDEVKVMFIDVKKAEDWVELLDEFKKFGKYARLKRWLYGMRKAASGWEDDYARLVNDGFQRGRAAS